jgi:Fic family protein
MKNVLNKLNKRQEKVLNILEKGGNYFISGIIADLDQTFGSISKITINRDLAKLINLKLVVMSGQGRLTAYHISDHYGLIKPVIISDYFQKEEDNRIVNERFNFNIFSFLKEIFFDDEKKYLESENDNYRNNIKKISTFSQKKEFERLVIEFSWKSSLIEGNTYTLLETESLIKENNEAKGHRKEEAIMILNHKKTLEYIRNNRSDFKKMSVSKIDNIHYLLTQNLNIPRGLRYSPVGIVGTKYRPLDNKFQIKEALEKTCQLVNNEKNYFAKAIILSVMIAYIQPFQDGNKRTSRMISNAILLAHGSCPLSYRSVDEVEYKKAVILFYEQNNISYFKQLFMEQFDFAVNNYFLSAAVKKEKIIINKAF